MKEIEIKIEKDEIDDWKKAIDEFFKKKERKKNN